MAFLDVSGQGAGIYVYNDKMFIAPDNYNVELYSAYASGNEGYIDKTFGYDSSGTNHIWYYNNILYLSQFDTGIVSTFNATTGALLNGNLRTFNQTSTGKENDGNIMFACLYSQGRVVTYNITDGALIANPYINGVTNPGDVAINRGNKNLYVTSNNGGYVGRYDISNASTSSSTARTINATFITGLNKPFGIVYRNGKLYISELGNGTDGTIKSFDAETGVSISTIATGLYNPWHMSYNSDYLYTAETGKQRIIRYAIETVYDPGTPFITTNSGSFDRPLGISVNQDVLYVTTIDNNLNKQLVKTFDAYGGGLKNSSHVIDASSINFLACYTKYLYTGSYDTAANKAGFIRLYNAVSDTEVTTLNARYTADISGSMGFVAGNNVLFVCNHRQGKIATFSAAAATVNGTVATATTYDLSYITGLTAPTSVALDLSNMHLYIVQNATTNGKVSVYDVSNANTSNATGRVGIVLNANLITGLYNPYDIIYARNELIISFIDPSGINGRISRYPAYGAANYNMIGDIATGLCTPYRITANMDYLYTADNSLNCVFRYPLPNKLIMPYTGTNNHPIYPGAYVINGGSGAYPIYGSVMNLAIYTNNNRDDSWIVMPGFSLIVYDSVYYSGAETLKYDNSKGSYIKYVNSSLIDRAESCQLFFGSIDPVNEIIMRSIRD